MIFRCGWVFRFSSWEVIFDKKQTTPHTYVAENIYVREVMSYVRFALSCAATFFPDPLCDSHAN